MKVSILKLLFLSAILVSSCESNEVINEPGGGAEYFINNQTSFAINVSFVTSAELGIMAVDALPPIPSSTSTLIHRDGILGGSPSPTDSFGSIRFVSLDDDSKEYNITSIDNDKWEILERDLNDSGFGLTKYELVVRDEDFE